MILPIIAYGDPILKKTTLNIAPDHKNLDKLLADMYDTMHRASGVGLAAPQIGASLNVFVTDASSFEEEDVKNFKQVFINAEILERTGEIVSYNEGCLSIPYIREDIKRPDTIKIKYFDENFVAHEEEFKGIVARIIQHEYDHTRGILITDHISPLRKRILKNRLMDIAKGAVDVDYKMKFPVRR